ncbi:AAA family ATPase [Flavobacterium sp. WC2429]|uniref:AAA family ATPase n=1 Tax=Flavobacterium sp. WC2429 TaxID=3234140 RepID=A0AB39WI93_9FLAO
MFLDKFIQLSDDTIHFTHDGVVTGSSGKTKDACIENIKQTSPYLVKVDGSKEVIDLGYLENGYQFEDENFQKFVGSFIEYSILRNNFKNDFGNKINMKEEFANWLISNDGGKSNYFSKQFGSKKERLLEELDLYEQKYKENFDSELFVIELKNSQILINSIKENIYDKTAEFSKFSENRSRDRPRAILGKDNYLKFLQEKLGQKNTVNYWIFQGNPKFYDVVSSLQNELLTTWKIGAHKDKIKKGDKVILWLTGENSGCYALAKVTSDVGRISATEEEIKYYKTDYDENEDRVAIEIEFNLATDPILSEEIKVLSQLDELKTGNRGTNFSATKSQYDAILNLINSNNTGDYAAVKKVLDPEKLNIFIKTLRHFIKTENIIVSDERLSFNVRKSKKRLIFIIGNRYAFCIEKRNTKTEISFIYKEILSEVSEKFRNPNGKIEAYLNTLENIEEYKKNIYEGFLIELERNNKCPHRKFINQDFAADVFSKSKNEIKFIVANITWNSKDWKEASDDNSGHAWVGGENVPHESWNFDFNNPRNTTEEVLGFAKFTNSPKVEGNQNLIIFYSQGKIVGFYGKAEVLKQWVNLNDKESYNLIGDKNFSVVLKNKIGNIKEKGFLEDKERVGQVGFSYLKKTDTALNILDEALKLNPEQDQALNNIKEWIFENTNPQINSNTGNMESFDKTTALNQILYGPPGTGKTFELQNTHFDNFTIRETALTREQYLESVVADLTWWQVISIAVFDLGKAKVNDIVNHELIKIKEKLSSSKTVRPTIWGQLQSHTVMECTFVNVSNRSEPLYFSKSEDSKWTIDEKLLDDYYPEAKNILAISKNYKPSNDTLIKNYDFVTFHQSFSYEDFVEGIKPKLDDGETEVAFEIKDGIFKKLCIKAEADPKNKYAIFIDEINRGNVSAIFGELITLIEDDKRLGAANELKVKLPYSKRELGVPSNLYIIGTMNTADRSVEALDTALRRRFSFSEIMPNPELLEEIQFNSFNLSEVLKTINERIEVLLDRDHTIGHSYFLKVKDGDIESLNSVFKNNIFPLLQEYFYHDYEKIALILGEGFVRIKENQTVKFAKFNDITTPDIATQFELIDKIEDIEAAVHLLLNRNV